MIKSKETREQDNLYCFLPIHDLKGNPIPAAASSETDYAVKMRGISSMSTQSHDQSSQRKPSSTGSVETEDPLKLGSDAKIEGQLSVWVQWTLPQASLSLLTSATGALSYIVFHEKFS